MIISKTPLRASLFGGGSDFREYYSSSKFGYGSVLSACLDMHVYITVNKKFDDKIRVVYNGNENVDSVDEVKHNIIREALRVVGIEKGIEIIYTTDIPISSVGTGLASSSSLAVGALNALHAYKGEYATPMQLAEEACYIEIEKLGHKIGIQDQFAVAHGGLNRYRFMNDGTVSVTPGIINAQIRELLCGNLLIFYTGHVRDSSKILAEQSASIEAHRKSLDELVLTVDSICDDLARGILYNVGEKLDHTWKIKKGLSSGISTPEIDEMYDVARKAGALGGKILGAGGGGFMLLYAPREKHMAVRTSLAQYREVPFNIDYLGSRIVFAD